MKKLFLIIAIAFSINVFSQEMTFKYQTKWIDFGVWQIPNGVDTSVLKNEWKMFFINDTIVDNYFKIHPEKEIKELQINDSTVWFNRNRYRWVVYENLSRQVQVQIRERMRIIKRPTQAEVDANVRYDKIMEYLGLGYTADEIRQYIDSVYYGIIN